MTKFRKYLLITAIPIVVFVVVGFLTAILAPSSSEIPANQALPFLSYVIACVLCAIALIATIPLAIMKKWSRVRGILAGLGIGVIAILILMAVMGQLW